MTIQPDTGSVSDTAKSEASNVAATAKEGAREVAGEASTQTKAVMGQAKQEIHGLVHQTREQVRQQADQRSTQAASGLRTLSEQVSALAQGRTEGAGRLPDYLQDAEQQVRSLAARLEEGGPQGFMDDITSFARRKPGLFLVGALGAGFLVTRVARAAAEQQQDSPSGNGQARLGQTDMTWRNEADFDDLGTPVGTTTGYDASDFDAPIPSSGISSTGLGSQGFGETGVGQPGMPSTPRVDPLP